MIPDPTTTATIHDPPLPVRHAIYTRQRPTRFTQPPTPPTKFARTTQLTVTRIATTNIIQAITPVHRTPPVNATQP
jgi:hypothetical protein